MSAPHENERLEELLKMAEGHGADCRFKQGSFVVFETAEQFDNFCAEVQASVLTTAAGGIMEAVKALVERTKKI